MKDKMMHGKPSLECCEKHRRYGGLKMLILGVLILWNVYWPMLGWPAFIGWIIAIAGLGKLLMPVSSCK